MPAGRLAIGLFSFQIPAALALLLGSLAWAVLGVAPDWMLYAVGPLAVVLLLGSLITWGLESFRPLPAAARARRVARYEVPSLILAQLPILFYAWLGGALFAGSHFNWDTAIEIYGGLLGIYLVVAGLPLVWLGLRGAVTPPGSGGERG